MTTREGEDARKMSSQQVAQLALRGGGGDDEDAHLRADGSLWHLLKAKTLRPPSPPPTPSSPTAIASSAPSSSRDDAVVEVSRSSARPSSTDDRDDPRPDDMDVTTSLSLRAVLHEASALAALLRAEGGVWTGDRVALLLRNAPLFVVAQYAIAGAGAIAVNCNTRLAAPELRAHFDDAGVKVVIADEAFAPTLALAMAHSPITPISDTAGAGENSSTNAETPTHGATRRRSSSNDVLVLWAPVTRREEWRREPGGTRAATFPGGRARGSGRGQSLSPPLPLEASIRRQRRLVFDSSSYELLGAMGDPSERERERAAPRGEDDSWGGGALRLPWTPEEEREGVRPRDLGDRLFQMMFTSGTTVGRRNDAVERRCRSTKRGPIA